MQTAAASGAQLQQQQLMAQVSMAVAKQSMEVVNQQDEAILSLMESAMPQAEEPGKGQQLDMRA